MKKILKWLIPVVSAAVILAAVGIGIGVYHHKQEQLPKFHDVTIELGTETLGIRDFMTQFAQPEKAAFITDVTQIDLGAVGETKITLRHGKKQETVTLKVQDTTAPAVEFTPRRLEGIGYEPKPEDFVVSVSDLSETTVSFKDPFTPPEVYTDLKLTVVVTDASGNTTEQVCTVTYTWMRESVTLELGTPLTKAMILMDAEKDGQLIDQAAIDEINAAGEGEFTVTATSGESTVVCKILVQDTQGPALKTRDVSIYENGAVSINSFVVSASDPSGQVKLELSGTYDVKKLGTYNLVIRATDPKGQVTEKEVKLHVVTDTTAPVISGLKAMSVKKNSTPDYLTGVSAYDAKDGSVGFAYNADSVDLTKAGSYTVFYSASDKAGNVGSYKRTVTVLPDAEDTKALVAQIAASQTATDPESLRNFVRSKIMYTSSWGGEDPVYYGFTKFQGNCYVHALCLKALLDYYGYTSQLIWVEPQYSPHYWLIININGTWYHIDPTPNYLHARYSLMNNAQRLETLSGRKWDTTLWPMLNPPAPEEPEDPTEPTDPITPTDPTEPSAPTETTPMESTETAEPTTTGS